HVGKGSGARRRGHPAAGGTGHRRGGLGAPAAGTGAVVAGGRRAAGRARAGGTGDPGGTGRGGPGGAAAPAVRRRAGSAVVRVAVAGAGSGAALAPGRGVAQFLLLAGGGVAVGAVVAGGVALIRWRTEDPVLETVTALVTPYAAYIAAEAAHLSGITAVVVA